MDDIFCILNSHGNTACFLFMVISPFLVRTYLYNENLNPL